MVCNFSVLHQFTFLTGSGIFLFTISRLDGACPFSCPVCTRWLEKNGPIHIHVILPRRKGTLPVLYTILFMFSDICSDFLTPVVPMNSNSLIM